MPAADGPVFRFSAQIEQKFRSYAAGVLPDAHIADVLGAIDRDRELAIRQRAIDRDRTLAPVGGDDQLAFHVGVYTSGRRALRAPADA